VRRAFLCGQDPLTGQSYEHRRALIEQRIHLLAGCFALSVHAYAVMSNHLHLVLYTDPAAANRWSDDEVIARWRSAMPSHKCDSKAPAASDDPAPQPKVSAEWIVDKRLRLASLSWFMKLLNENIARRANAEDGCTGHFWESRFRSQALLDERAITAAMAYVDLNPIRAGIAQTLHTSEYTSIAWRLRELADAQAILATSDTTPTIAPAGSSTDRLKPIAGILNHQLHHISTEQYIDLVAWSASIARPGKRHLESPTAALNVMGCDEAEWAEQLNAVRCGWRVVGGSAKMRELAQKIGQLRFKRRSRRPGEAMPARVDSG
jgi:REP element-mobilizing transposase RayT